MRPRPEQPVKLWYRIGEVARLVDVEPHVLRYWEGQFRSIRPQKSAKGQRVYSRRDVDTLLKVKDLLYAHRYTIEGAKQKLREGGVEPFSMPPPAAPAREVAEEVAAPAPTAVASTAVTEETRRMREALLSLRSEIRAAIDELDSL